MNMFQLKGCVNCSGDLFLDDGDWRCLQCGRYFYNADPWSYLIRRESAWGNFGRVAAPGDGKSRRRAGNKSAEGVAGV